MATTLDRAVGITNEFKTLVGDSAQTVQSSILHSLGADGTCMIRRSDGKVLAAGSLIPLTALQLGEKVLVVFDGGDAELPIILGIVNQTPGVVPKRIVIEASDRVEFLCGDSILTLRADGTIVLRGEYVVSRARRTNRIEGGAVQIN
jgi:Domain of unknown function (DUF6484)